MNTWKESVFRDKVSRAIDNLRRVLQAERCLKPLDQVPHQYDDKFALADQLTNATVHAAFLLVRLLSQDDANIVARLRQWAETNTQVTLRFHIESAIKFEEELIRKENEADERIITHSNLFGTSKTTQKAMRVVTEYRHSRLFIYRLTAWAGSQPNQDISLWVREIRYDRILPSKTTEPPTPTIEHEDINISVLLGAIITSFAIDRQKASCKTPRRNDDITRALKQFHDLSVWTRRIVSRIDTLLFQHLPERPRNDDLEPPSLGNFIPILPVFNEGSDSVLLSTPDLNLIQSEHERLLMEKLADLDRVYSQAPILISSDVKGVLILNQLESICSAYQQSLDFIEGVLYDQLALAVGKVLHQSDFDAFVGVHNRRLFRDEFIPIPFCYAIRRPDHAPEGIISIRTSKAADPILSQVRHVPASFPINLPINAATLIPFEGERFLHCCVFSDFQGENDSKPGLEIAARACQFSSYVLLAGSMTSARTLQPKYAIIVKDKDEIRIPLDVNQLPSAKEFRDAIESLSPEQQRFCRAFRAMQLESSLFAICTIQIKPQLELVLGLPDDSLTKEIQLTQDLMELFMRYQIPSDLLAYNGDPSANVQAKLDAVRHSVGNIKQIISEARAKQLSEAKDESRFRAAKSDSDFDDHHQPEPPDRMADISQFVVQNTALPAHCSMPMAATRGTIAHRSVALSAAVPSVASVPMPKKRAAMPNRLIAAKGAAQVMAAATTTAMASSGDQVPQADPLERSNQDQDLISFVQDFTKLPACMDRELERLDKSGQLRPTKIVPDSPWIRSRQESLLSERVSLELNENEQDREKNAAFDLLDALSKSGSLPLKSASLHVVVALTHNFTRSVIETIIEENINPIESIERSLLITSSTLHQTQPDRLVRPEFLEQSRISSSDLMQIEMIHTSSQ